MDNLFLKVLHGVALVNYNEHDKIVKWRIFVLEHVLEFCIQKVFCCLPKTSLYFASPIRRGMSSFVDKTMEGIQSSSVSSTYAFKMLLSGENMRTTFAPFAFLLLLRRVDDISDFPQSRSAKIATSFNQRRLTAASFCSSLSKEML